MSARLIRSMLVKNMGDICGFGNPDAWLFTDLSLLTDEAVTK